MAKIRKEGISIVIESVLIGLIIITQFSLIRTVWKLSEAQSKYEDEQYKQSWRIQSLENDKYELKGRINALEWEVKEKNADNDNACD